MLHRVKSSLGKYYPEILKYLAQEKYKGIGLPTFFEQSFSIQPGPLQMTVDSRLEGMCIEFNGSEVYVSADMYRHPMINIENTMESGVIGNPRAPFDSRIVGTIAYLVCQNHTIIDVVGDPGQPIYIKLSSDFEQFRNSVVTVCVDSQVHVEIVEEVESRAALCSVVKYVLGDQAQLSLTTFYDSRISATSLLYRPVTMSPSSHFYHTMLGNGAAISVDETALRVHTGVVVSIDGCLLCNNTHSHTILTVEPSRSSIDYEISVKMLGLLKHDGKFTVYPSILSHDPPPGAEISICDIDITGTPNEEVETIVESITRNCMLGNVDGVERFYTKRDQLMEQHYD